MSPMPLSLFALTFALLCAAPGAFAFADDYDGDRVIYANTPKDRYEAKIEMLEKQAEEGRAHCRKLNSGERSYCTHEIEKTLRDKKREAKTKYEAETSAAGAAD